MSPLVKRIVFITATATFIIVALIYLLIPSMLTVRSEAIISCSAPGANRIINTKWKEIFNSSSGESLYAENYQYTVQKPLYNGSDIIIHHDKEIYPSSLYLLPLSADTTIVQWNVSKQTGYNPINKAINYFRMMKLKKNMSGAIRQLQAYLSQTNNIYGYKITYTTLTDTVLVSTENASNKYPDTKDIYALISTLRKYIDVNHAKETNVPMLNISFMDNRYITMVGVPIDRVIEPNADIKIKRLIPIKNKILTTEVRGGTDKIKDAYKKIELYMQDHSLSAPVIPYELLIIDRSKQLDSTKWITKIIYPVA